MPFENQLAVAALRQAEREYRDLLTRDVDLHEALLREWRIKLRLEKDLLRAVRAGVFDVTLGFADVAAEFDDVSSSEDTPPLSRGTFWDVLTGELIDQDGRVEVTGGHLDGIDPDRFGHVLIEFGQASREPAVADLLRQGSDRVEALTRGYQQLFERRAFACDLVAGFASQEHVGGGSSSERQKEPASGQAEDTNHVAGDDAVALAESESAATRRGRRPPTKEQVDRVRQVLKGSPNMTQAAIRARLRLEPAGGISAETLVEILDQLRASGEYAVPPRARRKRPG